MSASMPSTETSQVEPETSYPALPDHVMERLVGYVGPGLRKRMARRREAAELASAKD